MKEHSLLVIGLDGADPELLRSWVERGKLPGVRSLFESGVQANLRTTIPPITPTAWSTFATGTNPGKHGLFDFVKRKEGSYLPRPLSASERGAVALWDILSVQGMSVGLFNVPMTFPVSPVNRYMISGIPARDPSADSFYPERLIDEVAAMVPDYEVVPAELLHPRGREKEFAAAALKWVNLRIKVFEYLRHRYPTDLTMMVFSETDWIQHALWACMDPTHPAHDSSQKHLADSILRVYQRIDSYLEELIASLDPNTYLIIMSDHGFGPLNAYIYVNTWLWANGFLTVKHSGITVLKELAFKLGLTPALLYRLMAKLGLGHSIGANVRKRKQSVKSLLDTLFLSFNDVDWSRSIAYSLGNSGAINVNLKGREPHGCVQPSEYDSVIAELTAALYTMEHPLTGERIVEKVYTKDELYGGPHLDEAPDLLFVPRDWRTAPFGDYSFPSNRWLEQSFDGRTGWHRMDGIFALIGPGIREGARVDEAHIQDIAPTALHLLGLPVLAEMDGRILDDAFTLDFRQSRPAEIIKSTDLALSPQSAPKLSEQDERVLKERLEGLGYIG